jgi:hypothetical protein
VADLLDGRNVKFPPRTAGMNVTYKQAPKAKHGIAAAIACAVA